MTIDRIEGFKEFFEFVEREELNVYDFWYWPDTSDFSIGVGLACSYIRREPKPTEDFRFYYKRAPSFICVLDCLKKEWDEYNENYPIVRKPT